MESGKAIVYISKLNNPFLDIGVQEDIARYYCKKENLIIGKIVKENDISHKLLKNYIEERIESQKIDNDILVITTISSLGDNLNEIISITKKLLDYDIKLYSIFDPINLSKFGEDEIQTTIFSISISYSIHQENFWKEYINSQKDKLLSVMKFSKN